MIGQPSTSRSPRFSRVLVGSLSSLASLVILSVVGFGLRETIHLPAWQSAPIAGATIGMVVGYVMHPWSRSVAAMAVAGGLSVALLGEWLACDRELLARSRSVERASQQAALLTAIRKHAADAKPVAKDEGVASPEDTNASDINPLGPKTNESEVKKLWFAGVVGLQTWRGRWQGALVSAVLAVFCAWQSARLIASRCSVLPAASSGP